MKLLIYSHFFAPSIGGVETIVLSLARGLSELHDSNGCREFEVTLVTQTPANDFDDSVLPFRVVRQPGLFQLWRLIRACDVIHAAGPALALLLLARLARKQLVIEHHGYQAICPNGLLVHQPDRSLCPGHFLGRNYLECWRCRKSELSFVRAYISLFLMFPRHWLSRGVAANVAVSQHLMERSSLPRSTVVYHGVDCEPQQAPLFVSAGGSPPKLCFAYVGRFVPEKGVETLLHATAILHKAGHDFETRLIGDGPLRPELEALIQQYAIDSCVRITGYLEGARLVEALNDVSAVVMPSVWEETAGLAAIEQMMRGKLVIASKIGGLAEIVDDSALTFPPGDAQALAETMKTVLQGPSMVETFGARARERALRFFRRERMISEHAHFYRKL